MSNIAPKPPPRRARPDSLIPYITFTRKWEACDEKQRVGFLSKLPALFREHDALGVLWSAILQNALCQMDTSSVLLNDIQNLLPSDASLHIEDTIHKSEHTSNTVTTLDYEDDNGVVKINSARCEPLLLLKTPSDVRRHIFHFLEVTDLGILQTVCRALCKWVRDPLSVHRISIEGPRDIHYALKQPWLARPKMLSIGYWPKLLSFINPHWEHSITNLRLIYGDYISRPQRKPSVIHFTKLKACKIFIHSVWYTKLYRTALATIQASSSTLEQLHFESRFELQEDAIAILKTLRNLKTLSLATSNNRNNGKRITIPTEPISLPMLQRLTIKILNAGSFNLFTMILIGSHPETICIHSSTPKHIEPFRFPPGALPAIRRVTNMEIESPSNSSYVINALHHLLAAAYSQSSHQFVVQHIMFKIQNCCPVSIGNIIQMCRYTQSVGIEWVLELTGSRPKEMTKALDHFLNMPRGTISNFSIGMRAILTKTKGPNGESHIANAITSMEAESANFMGRFINRSCDSAERWFNSLLENLSTTNIEQMGLHQLPVTLEYLIGSDISYWDDMTDTTESNVLEMVDLLECVHIELRERLNHHFRLINEAVGSRKRAKFTILDTLDDESYKVSLCLNV